MVSEPVFWNPNPFWLLLIQAIIHSGQISLAISQSDHLSLIVSHSGHQSLFSKPREKTLSDRLNRRQKTFTAVNFFGELSDELSGDGFFYTARSAWRRSPIFPKPPEPENHPRAVHARFSGRRLHLTRRRVSHFSATRFLLQARLTPTSHPPVSAIWALHVPLLGFFCLRGLSDQFFRRPPAIFSQLQSLHMPWEVFFYLSGPWQNTECHHHKYPTSRHQNQGADLKFQTLVAVIPLLFSSHDTN